MQQLQIDFAAEGRMRKQAGQTRAREGAGDDWISGVIEILKPWCQVRKASGRAEFRLEEFREFCEARAVRPPRSNSVWGTLPAIAAAQGLVAWTGRYEPARSPRTHAHPVKVWRAL